jgi:hypothetical protein
MPRKTTVVGDPDYENLASAYQMLIVGFLDEALRKAGVKPKRKRRQVCREFLYHFSVLHDQCWIQTEGRKVYPLLVFSDTFQNIGMSPQQLGKIRLDKDRFFSFDESALSALGCVFEPDESVPPVQVGLIGEDAPGRDMQ